MPPARQQGISGRKERWRVQPHSPLQVLAPKPHAFWGRLSVSQTADWKDMESPIRKGGFIVPWEPSAKGTPQFSLESSLHHPTCCRPSRLSHPLGEGLGPRGQTFHVMLLKATPCGFPIAGLLYPLRLLSGATEGETCTDTRLLPCLIPRNTPR